MSHNWVAAAAAAGPVAGEVRQMRGAFFQVQAAVEARKPPDDCVARPGTTDTAGHSCFATLLDLLASSASRDPAHASHAWSQLGCVDGRAVMPGSVDEPEGPQL